MTRTQKENGNPLISNCVEEITFYICEVAIPFRLSVLKEVDILFIDVLLGTNIQISFIRK